MTVSAFLLTAAGRSNPFLASAYMAIGKGAEAQAVVDESKRGSLRTQFRAYVGIGDIERAFYVLETALDRRAPWLVEEPNIDPYHDRLRSDARFAEYLRRMGLE